MQIIQGVVQRGEARGSTLGYPTLNIALSGDIPAGIYAGKVQMGGKSHMAAVFADPTRKIIEAHLLDFKEDVYGHEVTIELHTKIRDTKKFNTDAELKGAIAEDVAKVREYFKN